MREVAPDVWMIGLRGVNAYVVGDVLVDSGWPGSAKRIRSALGAHGLTKHVLTHAHPDHMGASAVLCEELGLEFMAGRADVAVAEDPGLMARDFVPLPRNPVGDAFMRLSSGPGRKVDRALDEGDEIAGFAVLDTPGHTRGHISLWRESDRVLICGDVLWNFPRLMRPVRPVNTDNAQLAASVRRITELEPALTCFGHGPTRASLRR